MTKNPRGHCQDMREAEELVNSLGLGSDLLPGPADPATGGCSGLKNGPSVPLEPELSG